MKKIYFFIVIIFSFFEVVSQAPDGSEMRAAWIATAKNIDYPTNKLLTVNEQKKEFIDILNMYQRIGINAVMVQIRPSCDSFYPSEHEPWSEWLTGEQGEAPDPYYDPLRFMIDECKKRNIEFHAWINPFRAVATIEYADICKEHVSVKRPNLCFTYGINKYLDPGIPEARNHVLKVICDIVRRYDIEGIHFDDYFYPYPEKDKYKRIISLPDYQTFIKYNKNFINIDDWRRSNMDIFIKSVNDSIKSIKPRMKFGVAPSGVWRNKSHDADGSDTRGFAHYDYLYADVVKWLREGWIDYVAPQLYSGIGSRYADYKTLVDWWSKHIYGRHLYIGHGVYKVNADSPDPTWRDPNELPEQIRINRESSKVLGSIFYKTSSMKKNPFGLNDSLQNNYYAQNVSTPKMEWLKDIDVDTIIVTDTVLVSDTIQILADKTAPDSPSKLTVSKLGRVYLISWDEYNKNTKSPNDPPVKFNIYKFRGFDSEFLTDDDIYSTTEKNYVFIERPRFSLFKKQYSIVVTALDKEGNESLVSDEIYLKLKKY
ncbi:MAG: family 10 glycosylhydrolase [bacterium]|nr:family 10 glycosylhydrolase [bacterium]